MADVHKDHPHEEHNFRFYSRPNNFAKLIGNKVSVFGTWGLIGYLGHFFLIIISINLYCDDDRLISCGKYRDGDEENSKVYDTALVLLASYHLIEWVRIIGLLVTMILGQNLVLLYYITSLNTLFGIAAYIAAHVQRFNEDGKACA